MTAPAGELAATKLRPPALPPQLVRRGRLDVLLDAGADGPARLVLVSAPAGSGKSTLVASWLAGRPEAAGWLQAEASDSDPARFWAHLVQAVRAALPELSPNLGAVLASSGGDELVVVDALVNALSELAEPLVLVVDDYHLIEVQAVHRGVERLVELSPTGLTVVLATRVDPPLRLGRLRVRRQRGCPARRRRGRGAAAAHGGLGRRARPGRHVAGADQRRGRLRARLRRRRLARRGVPARRVPRRADPAGAAAPARDQRAGPVRRRAGRRRDR